jgi:hypothetical protein
MLRILGSPGNLCNGISRREMMRVGGLGTMSLGLPELFRLRELQANETTANGSFGQAKRIILLYLYGAAAQHELYDLKPDAPAEIRGEFKPISTSVPGVQICEYLPKLAKIANRLCFIRSMTHPYNIHSAAYTLTGVDKVDIPMELGPYDNRHWPFFGSVLDYLEQQRNPGASPPEVPRNIALPFLFSSKSPEFDRGGPYGGFLGRAYNPVWTEFEGKSTQSVKRWRGADDKIVDEPFLGISPNDQLTVSKAAQLQQGITVDRLNRRRTLLDQIELGRRAFDKTLSTQSLDRFQQMAYSLISSRKIRDALDLNSIPMSKRDEYGMTLFGQSVLAGLRLLEAGSTLVSVFWDEFDTANSAWDTHYNHYERLKDELLPGLDNALSALMLDLEEKGMLDDTLVMCLTEHGRTPKIHLKERGVGREHWSNVYGNLMAGAGIADGIVVGSSDRNGAFVKDDPVSPKDILSTMYHLMGIDHHTILPDHLGRPVPLVSGGNVLTQMLG